MQQFTLDYDGIDKLIWARHLKMTPIIILSMIAGILFSSLRSERPFNLQVFLVIVGVMIIIVGFIIYEASQQFRRLLESYTLTFDVGILTREQYNTPTITFPIAEITEIARDKKGCYRIKAESWHSFMEIPARIDDSGKLHELLSKIRPIIEKNSHTSIVKKIGFVVAVVSFFILIETSTNKVILASCGLILIVGIIYSYIQTQRNMNIDYGAKRGKWLTIIIFIPIFLSIYRKLMG